MLVRILFREVGKRIFVIEYRHPLSEGTVADFQTHLGIVALVEVLRV